MLGVVLVVMLIISIVGRRYRRCPHCGKLVRRADRGWLRCPGCGRQYHRSVHLR
jgi:tRNA(Ile2) C34 agmatinyltransferase TiaS